MYTRHWIEAYVFIVGAKTDKHKQGKSIKYGYMLGLKYIALGETSFQSMEKV